MGHARQEVVPVPGPVDAVQQSHLVPGRVRHPLERQHLSGRCLRPGGRWRKDVRQHRPVAGAPHRGLHRAAAADRDGLGPGLELRPAVGRLVESTHSPDESVPGRGRRRRTGRRRSPRPCPGCGRRRPGVSPAATRPPPRRSPSRPNRPRSAGDSGTRCRAGSSAGACRCTGPRGPRWNGSRPRPSRCSPGSRGSGRRSCR